MQLEHAAYEILKEAGKLYSAWVFDHAETETALPYLTFKGR